MTEEIKETVVAEAAPKKKPAAKKAADGEKKPAAKTAPAPKAAAIQAAS